MTARLTVTRTFDDGYSDAFTVEHTAPVHEAAAAMRKRRGVPGDALTYDCPLTAGDRERGVVWMTHAWSDPDQMELPIGDQT